MSDYVNVNMQDQLSEENFPPVDWARLEDDVLHRPWLVFGGNDWIGEMETWDQAATEQLGDRRFPEQFSSNEFLGNEEHMSVQSTQLFKMGDPSVMWSHTRQPAARSESSGLIAKPPPTELLSHSASSPVTGKPGIFCHHEDCEGISFGRRSELNRHQRKHRQQLRYSCPAQGCNRNGRKGFARADKLRDHLFKGHDENTPFHCPSGQCEETGLTRNLLSIHLKSLENPRLEVDWTDNMKMLVGLRDYRTCPILKCPFFLVVRWSSEPEDMDSLPQHLIMHSAKGRAKFADLIVQRGYNASTGEVICPMCCRENRFQGHLEFYNHFLLLHCRNPKGYLIATTQAKWAIDQEIHQIFWASVSIAGEAFAHRHTLLSLWPNFDEYLVWDDIKCSGPVVQEEEV